MASPVPEAPAPAAESKPLEGTPSTDLKSDLNGASEPKPDAVMADADKPAVNGDGDKDKTETPVNGVNKDQDSTDAAKPDTPAEKPAEGASVESKDAPAKDAQPSTDAPKPAEENKDVEMGNADAPAAKADEPKTEESKPATADAPKTEAAPKEEPKESPADKSADATPKPEEKPAADVEPASLSQLAIESTEKGSSPVDVSMSDVPGAKVPREREDDASEEPAPKRARTEPKEDEPAKDSITATVPAAAAPAPAADKPISSADINLDNLPKWNDAGFNAKTIQPFQLRDLRKSMARVKKTKNGYHFRDSVQKLWPVLWDKYSASVAKPMDLGEIDRNLRDKRYNTFGDVKKDLILMADNSKSFNGPDHPMTMSAKAAIKSVWDDVMLIPDEEPVRPKALPKQNRMREPRAVPAKPEPAPRADAGADGAAPKSASAAPRKGSIADADRPKRTVRAPKPKDIDYSKPSRKKLKPELQFCDEVLAELMRDKYNHLNKWFNDPVDAEGLGIPHYYSVITQPMDFGKIHRLLHGGDIGTFKEFDKTVQLVFSNCYKFNGPPDPTTVSGLAKQLEDIYTSQIKNKDAWLAKHAKANPPPSASVGSDDEDVDDEDDEDDGAASAGPDPSREVKDLEVRLREEMDKQANLFAAEEPNQSMIQIQQGIVNMVQQALLQAKQKLNEYKQKNGGVAGKPKKAGKAGAPGKASKAAGGAGGAARKSGGALPAKKGMGGGGQKKKKNLSAADKDNIANAINDLEYPHLDKAIDIIKRDTGQMESEDGELELDIDQLSHEALLKLWDLCKKVLPGFGKDPNAAAAGSHSPEMSRGGGGGGGGGGSKQPKTAAKPKKNKPMSAQEQEARIAQLREIRDLYKPGQEPADEAQGAQEASLAMDDSSDDSSEEE